MKGRFRNREDYYRKHEKAKKALRRANARKPMKEKIREVVELQKAQMSANPTFASKWKGILPWKI